MSYRHHLHLFHRDILYHCKTVCSCPWEGMCPWTSRHWVRILVDLDKVGSCHPRTRRSIRRRSHPEIRLVPRDVGRESSRTFRPPPTHRCRLHAHRKPASSEDTGYRTDRRTRSRRRCIRRDPSGTRRALPPNWHTPAARMHYGKANFSEFVTKLNH